MQAHIARQAQPACTIQEVIYAFSLREAKANAVALTALQEFLNHATHGVLPAATSVAFVCTHSICMFACLSEPGMLQGMPG